MLSLYDIPLITASTDLSGIFFSLFTSSVLSAVTNAVFAGIFDFLVKSVGRTAQTDHGHYGDQIKG